MDKAANQLNLNAATELLDPFSIGSLNDLLRQKLTEDCFTPQVIEKPVSKKITTINEAIDDVVTEILSSHSVERVSLQGKLNTLFSFQKKVFELADMSQALRTRQYISHSGLVMSPVQCLTTQTDALRVHAFIRAIDQAIIDLRKKFQGTLHIVYPACGPLAPLLLPLICYYQQQGKYTSNDLTISLIDVQEGAVKSLDAVIKAFGITTFIHGIYCQDAIHFKTDLPIHMVILEAMQHGFSREGHLQIARHFANIMEPAGEFIPQKISIKAVLNIAQDEFIEQWRDTEVVLEDNMLQKYTQQRIELGEVLQITADSLRSLNEKKLDEDTSLIECNSLKIPSLENKPDKQVLMLCTRIKTYGLEGVGEYDSGITHPLPDFNICINFTPAEKRSGDLLLKSGDHIQFYYRLNGLPGFLATALA